MRVGCLQCRSNWIEHDQLACRPCRDAAVDEPALLERLAHDHQQHRLVMTSRFCDTKRFLNTMRAAAWNIWPHPVEGPAVVRIVGQRSVYPGDVFGAYRMVRENLDGVAFGKRTQVRSWGVTLIPGGYRMTVVEVRGMLEDEMAGIAGVSA